MGQSKPCPLCSPHSSEPPEVSEGPAPGKRGVLLKNCGGQGEGDETLRPPAELESRKNGQKHSDTAHDIASQGPTPSKHTRRRGAYKDRKEQPRSVTNMTFRRPVYTAASRPHTWALTLSAPPSLGLACSWGNVKGTITI